MRQVALEGRCFVISANQYLTRADVFTQVVDESPRRTVVPRG
jgi:hypothetical protein